MNAYLYTFVAIINGVPAKHLSNHHDRSGFTQMLRNIISEAKVLNISQMLPIGVEVNDIFNNHIREELMPELDGLYPAYFQVALDRNIRQRPPLESIAVHSANTCSIIPLGFESAEIAPQMILETALKGISFIDPEMTAELNNAVNNEPNEPRPVFH